MPSPHLDHIWEAYFNGVQYSLKQGLMDDTLETMVFSKLQSWTLSILIQSAVWYWLWRLQRNPDKGALGYCPMEDCCGEGRCGQGSFHIHWDDEDVAEYVVAVHKLDQHAVELSSVPVQPQVETYYAL